MRGLSAMELRHIKRHSSRDIKDVFTAIKDYGILREITNVRDFNGLVSTDEEGKGYLTECILVNAYFEFYLGIYPYKVKVDEEEVSIMQVLIKSRDRSAPSYYIAEIDLKGPCPIVLFLFANAMTFKAKTEALHRLVAELYANDSVYVQEYNAERFKEEALLELTEANYNMLHEFLSERNS